MGDFQRMMAKMDRESANACDLARDAFEQGIAHLHNAGEVTAAAKMRESWDDQERWLPTRNAE